MDDIIIIHINALENKAILLGVKSFFNRVRDKHVPIRSDNVNAVSYVNKIGGSKSHVCINLKSYGILHLKEICGFLQETCQLQKISLLIEPAETSMMLLNGHWIEIVWCYCKQIWALDIDLFATLSNAQLDIFMSWRPDLEAKCISIFFS